MAHKTASVFAQQPDEVLLVMILAVPANMVPAQRVRCLVKSVGRGAAPVHFSNVLFFQTFLPFLCQPPSAPRAEAGGLCTQTQGGKGARIPAFLVVCEPG